MFFETQLFSDEFIRLGNRNGTEGLTAKKTKIAKAGNQVVLTPFLQLLLFVCLVYFAVGVFRGLKINSRQHSSTNL